ncbi:SAM-dependent methyltransferase [Kitasatospora sp. NPDC089509]|uniref:SAM-dependent methyltransferase n=1 Tax=Kitasatospora sp. NPDC089509 TaxID=3364079 RepID=UPI0038064461
MGIKNDGIDVTVPSDARVYDWLLGGSINFYADRRAAERLLQIAPTSRQLVLNNRWFLHRVVHALATEYGVRQFLDYGCGLPLGDNLHQVAQRIDPRSRIVYVDKDPIVIAYGRESLDENSRTALIRADMTDTEAVFGHPAALDLIHPDEPTAVLFAAVLHCLPDEQHPGELIRQVVSRLAPGSFVVVSELVSDDARVRTEVSELMNRQVPRHWGRVREKEDVHSYFEGLHLERPGLVDVADWRPASELQQHQRSRELTAFGGLARVP